MAGEGVGDDDGGDGGAVGQGGGVGLAGDEEIVKGREPLGLEAMVGVGEFGMEGGLEVSGAGHAFGEDGFDVVEIEDEAARVRANGGGAVGDPEMFE